VVNGQLYTKGETTQQYQNAEYTIYKTNIRNNKTKIKIILKILV
jgi:hypothetical protein